MGKRLRDISWEEYGISKNRYRELLYFCRQYSEKKRRVRYGLNAIVNDGLPRGSSVGNPTESAAIDNALLQKDVEIIEKAAEQTSKVLKPYIIKNVCDEIPYEYMESIPVCRNDFYGFRRLFFSILDKMKK